MALGSERLITGIQGIQVAHFSLQGMEISHVVLLPVFCGGYTLFHLSNIIFESVQIHSTKTNVRLKVVYFKGESLSVVYF